MNAESGPKTDARDSTTSTRLAPLGLRRLLAGNRVDDATLIAAADRVPPIVSGKGDRALYSAREASRAQLICI